MLESIGSTTTNGALPTVGSSQMASTTALCKFRWAIRIYPYKDIENHPWDMALPQLADPSAGSGQAVVDVVTQADVPPQNIIAMWEALQEYGVY